MHMGRRAYRPRRAAAQGGTKGCVRWPEQRPESTTSRRKPLSSNTWLFGWTRSETEGRPFESARGYQSSVRASGGRDRRGAATSKRERAAAREGGGAPVASGGGPGRGVVLQQRADLGGQGLAAEHEGG